MADTNWGGLPNEQSEPEYRQQLPLDLTNYKVPIDRGAQIRFTGLGMAVYMLYDEPGVYYNDHYKKVPEPIAATAGFDIEYNKKLKKRNEMMRKMARDLDADFTAGVAKRIVAQAEDYQVVEIASDLYNIEWTEDGSVINTRGALSFEMARNAFLELTGVDLSAPAEPSQPGDADVEKPAPKRAK